MELVEGFIQDCQARGLTDHTIETYASNVRAFMQAYNEPRNVNLEELRAFLGDLRARGYTGSTLKGYFSSISAFFEYLMIEGTISSNPVIPFR